VHELGGGLYAKLLAATAVLLSALLRLNLLFQPNSFDILAWTAAYYCLIRYLNTRRTGWMLAIGAVYLEHLLRAGRWRYVRPVLVVVIAALFVPMLLIAFPNRPPQAIQQKGERYRALGLLRWEDGRDHALPQDFADMLGWREMAAKTEQAYQLLPDSLRPHTLVLCDNYGQTGALNYYALHRLPPAVSVNADYVYWFPDLRHIQAIILVSNDALSAEDARHFARVQQTGTVAEPLAREYGTRIYLLTGPDAAIMRQLKQEITDGQQLK
jgi:hypothetical protein